MLDQTIDERPTTSERDVVAGRPPRGWRWLATSTLLAGSLTLGGCRDEEQSTQPDQPCCGQCGYDGLSVCQRCGYMDICFRELNEGDPCSGPADGKCHCGDDPDCSRALDGQVITPWPVSKCDVSLLDEVSSPGRSVFGGHDHRLYFSNSPECGAGEEGR